MIAPTTRLRLARVPLAQIIPTEAQPRFPKRLRHYIKLLRDPRYADHDPGVVALRPFDYLASNSLPLYTLLDGHHRWIASIAAGRCDLLALIHYEPGDPGYDDAQPVCAETSQPTRQPQPAEVMSHAALR